MLTCSAATPTEAAEYIRGDFYLMLDFMENASNTLKQLINRRLANVYNDLENTISIEQIY